jgi:hypothetical protein
MAGGFAASRFLAALFSLEGMNLNRSLKTV